MGKKVGNVEIDGQIDGRFTSYYNADKHGSKTGETVAGSTADDNGDEWTDDWPSAVDADPEDLTEKQEAVIRAAARYPTAGRRRLGEIAGCSEDYPRDVLKEHWPGRYPATETHHQGRRPAFDADRVADMRKLLLAGATTSEIADQLDTDAGTISKYVRGKKTVDPDDPPAIEYNGSEWVIPDDSSDEMADTSETETETETETERVEHETDAPERVTVPVAALAELDRTLTTAERIGTEGQTRLAAVIRDTLPEIEEVSADDE